MPENKRLSALRDFAVESVWLVGFPGPAWRILAELLSAVS